MRELVLNPVFIDTSIFFKYNFNFGSTQFEQLVSLSNEKLIRIVLTEIVNNEIYNKIESLSQAAEDSYKNFIKKNAILKHNIKSLKDLVELENKFKKEEITQQSKRNYEEWLQKAKVEILPVSDANSSQVFRDYFNQSPPFHLKKKEFPDAFNLSIICNKFEKILVVSTDKDIIDFQHPKVLQSFDSLNAFIDFTLKQRYSVYDLIVKEFNKQRGFILTEIKEGFPTLEFISLHGSYVEEPSVKNLYINSEEVIKIEESSARINLKIIVYYDIPVFYAGEDDYKIESDSHIMDIEIGMSYHHNQTTNSLEKVQIEKITPKTWEESIILINVEEFMKC